MVCCFFAFFEIFFDPMVFSSVESGHVIGFVQDLLTQGHNCR